MNLLSKTKLFLMKKEVVKLFSTTFLAIILSLYALSVTGCMSNGSENKAVTDLPDTTDEAKNVSEASKQVGEVGEKIEERADVINEDTDSARKSLEEEEEGGSNVVEPQLSSIDEQADGLRKDSKKLEVTKQRLEDTEESLQKEQDKVESLTEDFGDAQEKINNLQDQVKELESKASRLLKEKMAWVGVVSVFGIGVSVVLIFFTRSMMATMVAVGFVATLGVSIAVSLYMDFIAIVAISAVGLVVLAVVGYLIYQQISNDKSQNELVRTSEIAKDYLSQEARDHIFGRGAEPGVCDLIQNKNTKKLVNKLRRYNSKEKRGFDLSDSSPKKSKESSKPPSKKNENIMEDENSLSY